MKKNIIVAYILTIVFITASTDALKLAPFPDSKSLQPMPREDVHPNISGNVNSDLQIAEDNQNSEANPLNVKITDTEKVTMQESAQANSTNRDTQNASNLKLLLGIGLLSVVCLIFILIIKKLPKKTLGN